MNKHFMAMTLGLFLSNQALAIGWTCNNQWGGHYRFDGSLNTVDYSGPLDPSDVLFGRSQWAVGSISGVVPLVGWAMQFPTLGYAYVCRNSSPQVARCIAVSGNTVPLELNNCVGFL